MTVSELIERLQKCPPNSIVLKLPSMENDKWDNEIRDVIVNRDGTVDLDHWPAEGF